MLRVRMAGYGDVGRIEGHSSSLHCRPFRSIIGKRKRERQLLGPGGRAGNVTRRYRRAVSLCMSLVIIYAKRAL